MGFKLLFLIEVERIRSVSDVFSVSSDNQSEFVRSNSSGFVNFIKLLFVKKVVFEVEVNIDLVGGQRVQMVYDSDEFVSKQLIKLVQIVQQYYGFVDEVEEYDFSLDGSLKGGFI